MYERFYRLRERPFALTPDPDYLYPSRVHREAMNYLRYGIETHAGFVVITGAIGSGKTTLLQTLLRGLDSQTTVARVMNTLLDPRELIEAAMIDLGLDPAGKSKPAMLKEFGEFLVNERAGGRLVLLVIDEAQNLSLPALEEIRMLSNLETEKSKLVQIILVGQPDLRDKLDRPELEQLRQRITVSYHLEALDAEETARYINHRLARASVGVPLEFATTVTDRIHERSAGVPRLINVIADATLVFGYGEERPEIDAALVNDVIADLDATGVLGPRPNPERHASVVPAEPGGALSAAGVAAGGMGTMSGVGPMADAGSMSGMGSGVSRIDGRANPVLARADDEGALQADPATAAAIEAERQRLELAAAEERRRLADLTARERQLADREQDIVLRERELAEQRKVLVDQYRILRSTATAAAQEPQRSAATAGQSNQARQGWPSARVTPTAPADTPSARWQAPRVYRSKRPSLWRRVKHTLLGSPEPVLEDSL
jgi:putative secretion ATPase (PEP-CTERM system associated)